MIPAPQALWPLASAAAALAFLLTRPWRRPEARLAIWVAGALIVADALWLLAASVFPTAVAPIAVVAALLLIAFGATVASATDVADGESTVPAPRPVPRPSPCSNEVLLRLAIDQGEQAVAVSRFDGEMVFVNGAWARLHGLRVHEVTGHRWSLFHTPEQMHESFRPLMARAEAEGHDETVIGRRRPDGTTFETRTGLTLVCDPESAAAIGWLAVAWPLDGGRPSSAEDSEPSGGDYSPAAVAFGRKVRETAHDFNNLLSAVVGNAGLVLEQVEGDPELQREVEEIESAAMRAAELATRLQTDARRVAPPGDPEADGVVGSTGASPQVEGRDALDELSGNRPRVQPSAGGVPVAADPTAGAQSPTVPSAAEERPTILVVDNEKIVRDLA
ncbi:MAG: PAS domain S-box protein, partial [Acidobacteriota bacterium]